MQKHVRIPKTTCTGVFASKHALTFGSGCHSMAGPFDLIPSQNLFECKPVAPHMSGEASATMLQCTMGHIALPIAPPIAPAASNRFQRWACMAAVCVYGDRSTYSDGKMPLALMKISTWLGGNDGIQPKVVVLVLPFCKTLKWRYFVFKFSKKNKTRDLDTGFLIFSQRKSPVGDAIWICKL